MAKKEISDNGLEQILGSFAPARATAPSIQKEEPQPNANAEPAPTEGTRRLGRPVGTTKNDVLRRPFSMKMQESHYQKLHSVAYWDRLSKQDVMDMALEEFFSKYEKANGAIKLLEDL